MVSCSEGRVSFTINRKDTAVVLSYIELQRIRTVTVSQVALLRGAKLGLLQLDHGNVDGD